ncbi:MAG: DUF4149 domain-containing protein [Thiogranum sp.]
MQSERILAGERILLTLWVGGLWTTGYVVAPALFASLDDRALAGTLAGVMFGIMAWIGLLCAVLLLLSNQLRNPQHRLNWRALVLLAMLALILVGQFVLAPMIAEMRLAGASEQAEFARLHGAAAMGYLITSVLGLALVAVPAQATG